MITIIVILILAAISLTMLTGDNGILNKAVLAKDATRGGEVQETVNLAATYNTGVDYTGGAKQTREEVIAQLHSDGKLTDSEVATQEENDTIVIGGITIDFSVLGGNNWVYDHATQTITKGDLTLKIGDYVNTSPYTVDGKQFDGKWRVLGEENGQLLLVSANYVDFQGSTNQSGVPAITLQGSNGIDNEIDRLNTLSEKFVGLGENSNITSPFTIKSTYYGYFPETLGYFPGTAVASGQTTEGISTTSSAYDMLFKLQSNIPYYLASPCVHARAGEASWGLFVIQSPGMVNSHYLWDSYWVSGSLTYGVRPVASLKSNITPTLNSTNKDTGISTYEI